MGDIAKINNLPKHSTFALSDETVPFIFVVVFVTIAME